MPVRTLRRAVEPVIAAPRAHQPMPANDRQPVRYARWDGGPIHVVKGVLSGWPYVLEPDEIHAAMAWYDDANLVHLVTAELDWIWVTWSVGFPVEDEARQQRLVADYIADCHRLGVRVTAYLSMANVFPDAWRRRGRPAIDEWLQRDAQGRPIPYGAADYAGAPSRFLACLRHPGWREYLLAQVRSSLAAGVDGIIYDNVGSGCQCDRCAAAFRTYSLDRAGRAFGELPDFGHAAAGLAAKVQRVVGLRATGPEPDEQAGLLWRSFVDRLLADSLADLAAAAHALRPDVLVYANNNVDMGTLAYPAADVVSTEDGREPGIATDGTAVENAALFRLAAASSDGWRPVRVESAVGHGMVAVDELGWSRFIPMAPRAQQRAIAEAAMYGASAEINPEGYLKGGLSRGDDWALDTWRAIGRYHAFLAAHPDLYTGARSIATTAVVVPDSWPDGDALRKDLLGALVAGGVDFDVVLDRQLSTDALLPYRIVLLADVPVIGDQAGEALGEAVRRGSTVLATPGSGRLAPTLLPAADELVRRVPGLRRTVEVDRPDALAGELLALSDSLFRVSTDGRIVWQVRRTNASLLVHLLNLGDVPVDAIALGGFGAGLPGVFSPDPVAPDVQASGTDLRVRGLDLYAVLQFDGHGSPA
jgi:hypothetical protein